MLMSILLFQVTEFVTPVTEFVTPVTELVTPVTELVEVTGRVASTGSATNEIT